MPMRVQNPGTERKFSRDVSTSFSIPSASPTTAVIIAGIAGFQIVVQLIEVAFVSSGGDPYSFFYNNPGQVDIAVADPAAASAGPITFDFGEDGFVLPDGKELSYTTLALGDELGITVAAYLRPTPDTAIVAHVAGSRGFSF